MFLREEKGVLHGAYAELIRSVLQKDYKYFITVVRRINLPGELLAMPAP
jgi:hypothetical protein